MSQKKQENQPEHYFDNVKKGQEIFGLIFGRGEVCTVWGEYSYYKFEVIFNNGYTVPYTEEGVPAWNIHFDFQTIFYPEDIKYNEQDFGPTDKVLEPKEIIKLRLKNKLEVRCPSGLWQKTYNCPDFIVHGYLEDAKFHLFRKTPKK